MPVYIITVLYSVVFNSDNGLFASTWSDYAKGLFYVLAGIYLPGQTADERWEDGWDDLSTMLHSRA